MQAMAIPPCSEQFFIFVEKVMDMATTPSPPAPPLAPPSTLADTLAPKVDAKLLEMLVCPLTKGRLEYDATAQELISPQARLAYPIRDGIPIMLPDEARSIAN
jgi:uncharacterized protein